MIIEQTSTTYNVFSILQLPVPNARNGKIAIERCLDAFFDEEVLEKDDAWYVGQLFSFAIFLGVNIRR